MASSTGNFYDKLELKTDASKIDIKKAYRRLALKYHPDKNSDPSATDRFREVAEAYEVLSDDDKKRDYDREIKRGGGRASSSWHQERRQTNPRRDPFAQFNDLFQNDPFFREAAAGLDDLFAKTFQGGGGRASAATGAAFVDNKQKESQSWLGWLGGKVVEKLGINVQISTSTTMPNGQRSTSSYSSRPRSGAGGSRSYSSKSTRTVIENGQRVTIQSLERDGNKIEEKFVGTTLVGRTINGVPEAMGKIEL